MADNLTPPTDDTLDPNVQTPDNLDPEPKNATIKQMRKQIQKEAQARAKAEKELEAIRQAELDKTKTLEEKALESQKRVEELEKLRKQDNTKYQLEKELLKNNVNTDFLDLILKEGLTMDNDDLSLVVDELKEKYKSAFNSDDKPKPIGKIGVNQTTGQSASMSKEEVMKIILDPSAKITPEIAKLVQEYKL